VRKPVQKLALPLGILIAGVGGLGATALATHATATVTPGPPPCAHESVQVDGTPVNVNQDQCAPVGTADLPPLPTPPVPNLPALTLPGPPSVPTLPGPPTLPVPNVPVPVPQVPSTPSIPTISGAALGSGCSFQSARSDPPSPNEVAVTLPDGTVIYRYMTGDPTTGISGYMGGTNSLGTLEGSGSASPSGVSGQIGGHNNQTGADGYIGTDGACLNGNSLP
jgi:hypothetical protein